ncbi:MAG TPA: PHP domain-containing protein [Anaerovoracaceae bacterium]|nr:PHP domain-containing protein [Anaerovoracaceae bacterium]
MEFKVDYHIHTCFSDGKLTPAKIVKKFKDEEYDIIAITDHDGIDGLNEAKIAGETIELKVVPGVELSALIYNEISIHILGYNIDVNEINLKDSMLALKSWREDRNLKLIDILNSKGYKITLQEIYNKKGNTYVGKPDIARMLVEKGYISGVKQAFEKENGIFEVPEIKELKKKKLDSSKAIEIIKNAKGTPVLAHPMKIKGLGDISSEKFFMNLDKLVRELKKQGLKGMECFHPSAKEDDEKKLLSIAEKYHLHITKGSDFHGDNN